MKTSSVREQLLEHASVLMRRRGYNGFSYRDLAELVGVKTSSIHYYFPSKDDLVLEVVRQYRQTSVARLAAIDTSLPLIEQARKYVLPLSNGIDLGQICLIGMLAAEVMVLPQAVRALLQEHFRRTRTSSPTCCAAPRQNAASSTRCRPSYWPRCFMARSRTD
jgi:TetR/AcrR family transcriptional repressor of nem operon